MMHQMKLQRFAEDAVSGVIAADAGQPTGVVETTAIEAQAAAVPSSQSTPAASDGLVAPDAPGATSAPAPDKAKAFEKLIDGEYKEEFAKRVQGILGRRLARARNAEQQLEAIKSSQRQQSVQKGSEAFARLVEEANRAQQIYPDMVLKTELENPAFKNMLRAGVPVVAAYEAVHSRELMESAMRYTARTVAEKMAQSNAGYRVQENGAGGLASAEPRPDVTRMSRAQRRALIQRARAGETITF